VLDEVDFSKQDFVEAVGISDEEFLRWADKLDKLIKTDHTTALLAKKIKITFLKITVTYQGEVGNVYARTVVDTWKEQGRKEISIEECMGTFMLLCTLFVHSRFT